MTDTAPEPIDIVDVKIDGGYRDGIFTAVTQMVGDESARLTFEYNAEGVVHLETLQAALAEKFDDVQMMILEHLATVATQEVDGD